MLETFGTTKEDFFSKFVRCITDLIFVPGLIAVDYGDIRTILTSSGNACFGFGISSGKNRSTISTKMAINSPTLAHSIKHAKNILLTITAGKNLALNEAMEARNIIGEVVDENATIIYGHVAKEEMGDKMEVSIIASGYIHY
jgi:cell division protein FtsZ